MKLKLAVAIALAALAATWLLLRDEPYVPRPLPPARPSGEFKATVMVPTLETPIPAGKNAVWCGAFQLAWNRFKTDVEKGAIRLVGAEAVSEALNGSPFGDGDLEPGSFYAAAGTAKSGMIDRIRREMGDRFPGVTPNLPEVPDLEAMAYAYLAASLRFKHAYRERKEGVGFTDGAGKRTRVKGFGILAGDAHGYSDVYHQPLVLHVGESNDFIVDPDPQSKPHQLLLAMMDRPATLKEAVEATEAKAAAAKHGRPFMGAESLTVPDLVLGILHRFGELERKPFVNNPGQVFAVAQQSIQFRLDRGGAELKAEAALMAVKSAAPRSVPPCHFDRPFLLLMKKRGAARPYLAVWVDNPEILDPR